MKSLAKPQELPLFLIGKASLGMAVRSAGLEKRLEQDFYSAGISGAKAGQYIAGSLLLSLAASLLLFFALFAIIGLPAESFSASLVFFGAAFLLLVRLPGLIASKMTEAQEAELPFLASEFAIYLEIGMPFEKALQKISESGYLLSPYLAGAASEIRSGSTVPSSLAKLASRKDSMPIKRFLLICSTIYETGSGADSLRRLSDELSFRSLSELRAISGRLSVLSIVFIATSALIPSFFLTYAAISPLLSGVAMQEAHFLAAFLLLFPSLNAAALSAVFLSTPSFFQGGGKVLGGISFKPGEVKIGAQAIAAAGLAALSILLFLAGLPHAGLIAFLLLPCWHFANSYKKSGEIQSAQRQLPDALYGAASVHRIFSAEKTLSYLAKGGFGRISDAFEIAQRRMASGDRFPAALRACISHLPTPLFARAVELLIVSYETGANMYHALRFAANDIASFFLLVKERSALLSIQRYTVLAAACVLVPLILGAVLAITPSLSGTQGATSPIPALIFACQAYLLLNAIISSAFLSLLENSPPSFAAYAALSVPLSQLFFALSSSAAPALA